MARIKEIGAPHRVLIMRANQLASMARSKVIGFWGGDLLPPGGTPL
ncbi:MAG: hypothetical protein GTO03_05735 [Planctomycetales bacterium]|nr:hypothetical protein [Planctomycetales bacterium]